MTAWDIASLFEPRYVLTNNRTYVPETPEEIAASVKRFQEAFERASKAASKLLESLDERSEKFNRVARVLVPTGGE